MDKDKTLEKLIKLQARAASFNFKALLEQDCKQEWDSMETGDDFDVDHHCETLEEGCCVPHQLAAATMKLVKALLDVRDHYHGDNVSGTFNEDTSFAEQLEEMLHVAGD